MHCQQLVNDILAACHCCAPSHPTSRSAAHRKLHVSRAKRMPVAHPTDACTAGLPSPTCVLHPPNPP